MTNDDHDLNSLENIDNSNENSFVHRELKILDFWKQNNIFQKSLEKNRLKKPYIFYDGPPFATGLPHHGHLVGSTLKDTVPRYFTMKGFYVDRRFGWDCHGLPVEYEIDKSLGMSAHDAVKKLGVKNYNDQCRSIVQKYVLEWEKTITRLGRWVDFKRDYKTMDATFMESVWWVLSELFKKNLIYQSVKVMPFSTALGTPLSNFEAGSNYQEVQDPSITILFPLRNSPNRILAAWTTTPWTLPSNLGLCINPELLYAEIVIESLPGKTFILAKDRLESYAKKFPHSIQKEFLGSELIGLEYIPLFSYYENLISEGAFRVHGDSYVTTSDGTGIVHLAPAFGEDDFRILGKKVLVCPVDDAGKFTKDVPEWQGLHIKEADKHIIKSLKDNHKLLDQSTLVHSYPFCPRSQTPLIYKTVPSWFVAVEKIKDKMIKANQEIRWVPEHLKDGRFGQWLNNARDWAISRNRIWGTPLPLWINNESGKIYCVGSIAELAKLTGTSPLTDLHREFVDDLTFTIPGEIGTYKRVKEVLDCWFESGSMPYAQLHYPFENKEVFKAGFPAEFIAEGLDQTRGWFYTLTVLAAALEDKPAFKNVIVNGLVLAKDGKKMSKSLRNYTAPDVLMKDFGADALRLFLLNSGLVRAEDLRFSDDGVKDMIRRVMLPWFNSFKFFTTYAESDNWKPKLQNNISSLKSASILDDWILSKAQGLIEHIDREMNQYQLYNVIPELFTFIDHLTNWYIRLNRRRFWSDGLSDLESKSKESAYQTLYTVLSNLNMMMAPFAPFLSESLFQDLKKFQNTNESHQLESVHLADYPTSIGISYNKKLEKTIAQMQQVILLGRTARIAAKIKVKIPLSTLTIIHQDTVELEHLKQVEDIIKTELNVKKITYSSDEDSFVTLSAKPNFPILGKKVGAKMSEVSKLIAKLNTKDLKNFELAKTLNLGEFHLTTEDVQITRVAKNPKVLSHPLISIMLETQMTEDLLQEGLAREFVSHIQKARKDQQLQVADRIHLKIAASAKLLRAINTFKEYILSETLALNLEVTDLKEGNPYIECDTEKLHFQLQKASS